MIMQGVPVPFVQKLAGHADIKTTMGYAHLAPKSLQDALERVFSNRIFPQFLMEIR
jgi:site-specific recombinase XerD